MKLLMKKIAGFAAILLLAFPLRAWTPPDPGAWQEINAKMAASHVDTSVWSVAADRTNGWLYALTNGGLWRSTDQGNTFAAIGRAYITGGGMRCGRWSSLQVHPEDQFPPALSKVGEGRQVHCGNGQGHQDAEERLPECCVAGRDE